MARKVRKPSFDGRDIFSSEVRARNAAVHLQSPDRRHHDAGRRGQAGLPALDIEEFLGTEIGPETSFGHDIVG